MRLEGDIKTAEDIEHLIRTKTEHIEIKHRPIGCQLNESSLSTRRFRVFLLGYNFDICLRYDYRKSTARFDMKDCNSQVLFVKVPELANLLHESRKMIFRWRDGEEMRTREIKL
jgi:hypothetical protein